jgi:HPt (histidine-containing phosphotransfer) domain-containing protein
LEQNRKYIDLSYLKSLANNDSVFIEELIRTFLLHTPELIEEIDLTLENKNTDLLASHLHKIKTSFKFMGIHQAAEKVQIMEEMLLKDSNSKDLKKRFIEIKIIMNKASQELQEFQRGSTKI